MNLSGTAILVASWNGSADLWKPFFKLFALHWPDCPFPIFLGTDRKPSIEIPGVTIYSAEGATDYSSAILGILDRIPQERLLLWVDDFFIARRVDSKRILRIMTSANEHKADWLNFVSFPYELPALFGIPRGDEGLLELPSGSPYCTGLGAVYCKKRVLKEILKPGESAWDIERSAALRTHHFDFRFFCLQPSDNPAIRVVNAAESGLWTPAGREALAQAGLLAYLGNRGHQTERTRFLIRLYAIARYCAVQLCYRIAGRHFMRWLTKMITRQLITAQN